LPNGSAFAIILSRFPEQRSLMASLGHIAVGIAASRLYPEEEYLHRPRFRAMLFWAALSFLPDADVIAFAFGVPYADQWGHRGASHSFVFAVVVGIAIALIAPRFHRPALRTGAMAALVVATHPLLDLFTNGGLGCALFWPFDSTRYFAPWRPIPVSPIGLGYLSPYGMYVAATELVLFAPLAWYGLQAPRRKPTGIRLNIVRSASWMAWSAALWLLLSNDPVRERIVTTVMRDTTQFAPGFSEQILDSVQEGQTRQQVHGRIGTPLREFMFFGERPDGCAMVRIESQAVAEAQPMNPCGTRGIRVGTPRDDVLRVLGTPQQNCWMYTRSPDASYYRMRAVCFEGDRVAVVIRRWVKE
jgi:inner membrane protein